MVRLEASNWVSNLFEAAEEPKRNRIQWAAFVAPKTSPCRIALHVGTEGTVYLAAAAVVVGRHRMSCVIREVCVCRSWEAANSSAEVMAQTSWSGLWERRRTSLVEGSTHAVGDIGLLLLRSVQSPRRWMARSHYERGISPVQDPMVLKLKRIRKKRKVN